MKLLLTALFLFAMCQPCTANDTLAQSKDGRLVVEDLPVEVKKEFEGCGCGFYPPGYTSLLSIAWDYSQRDSMTAAIQVNGKTERLPLVGEKHHRKRGANVEPQKGDATEYKFSSGSVTTVLSCKVSETCWGTPGCEYIGYSCAAQVSAASVRVKFPLNGGCGC